MASIAEFEIEEREGVTIAHLDGEVDISNVGEVKRRLTDCVPNSALGLVVDLSGVRYLDSSGLHVLFEISGALSNRRQSIRVVAPEGSASQRVLELTAFDRVVPMSASVAEAVTGIGSDSRVTARPDRSSG